MPAITMPSDFPAADFDSLVAQADVLEDKFRARNSGNVNPDWVALASAANGLTYRWRAMVEAQSAFQSAFLKLTKSSDDRYFEETALFAFFTNGVSALELFYFAVYGLAAQLEPAKFDLINKNPRAIVPKLVTERFGQEWPNDGLTNSLRQTLDSQAFKDLTDVRNILSHRAAPGRSISLTIVDVLGAPQPPQPPPTTTWIGRPLDAALLPSFRSDIGALVNKMVGAAAAFANAEVRTRSPLFRWLVPSLF